MGDSRSKTVITEIPRALGEPASGDACLVVIYGLELGRKYNLEQQSTLIGRSSTTDVQLDQESVSRHHAKIINASTAIILRDLESTNGTYVNDQPIKEYVLRDGDLVKIGRTIFKFLSRGNIENAYHEEIYRLTTVDGLTQIYNRRYLLDQLDRELSRARRYQRPLSLVMFDIDRFKLINDTYGHLAGDFVLTQLAGLVKAHIRREDLFARYGGEEFAIVLPEIDGSNARSLAEKVRKLIEEAYFEFERVRIPITVSLGIASLGADSGPVDTAMLIKRADEKLYEAKDSGRNCVRS
jgi:two-component system cell cycle response regulator